MWKGCTPRVPTQFKGKRGTNPQLGLLQLFQAGEVAQQLRVYITLEEDLSSGPNSRTRPFTAHCDSSSRGICHLLLDSMGVALTGTHYTETATHIQHLKRESIFKKTKKQSDYFYTNWHTCHLVWVGAQHSKVIK